MSSVLYYESPIGTLKITATSEGITGICPSTENIPVRQIETPPLVSAVDWLDCYFAGKKPEANLLPLVLNGTYFQKRVWLRLLQIPYGVSVTYGQLAKEFADKGKMSAQAIGQAVGANPISLVIPCHRVLGKGGKLTGYAWGLVRKKWLLDHEKICYK